MSEPASLKVPEILERMKSASGIGTDAHLATHLGVSNKTVSSWRSRNSIPIEAILQISEETNRRIDYFLFGEDRPSLSGDEFVEMFQFDDLRIKDFEIAGESIIVSVLGQFADQELAFMDEKELSEHGKSLGASILRTLALIRHERRALLDSGKMDEASFNDYARKAFRTDLPHFVNAIENRAERRKKEGPQ
ncbi:helix-turn-helix domain containing protein [Rhizobium lemnae]|uniref:Helix-turn-helix domain-containing protein n=1 Tax=Rhizobium lemnae TaxID=1214924 RepID=A0ABV8E9P2_9HYPH|nr:helix-turn-helix domain-containing protein [Rhizobium lemnae]MCJ8509023.1 helix-turn-helix domain containing protein [Rhizobium lemnae]